MAIDGGFDVRYARLSSGAALAYGECGRGVPVVVMPVTVTSQLDLSGLAGVIAARLSERGQSARIITYEHCGWGMSRGERADHSAEAFVAELKAVLAVADVDRCLLVSSSPTGVAAMRFAADHPDRVRALVLCRPWLRGHDYVSTAQFQSYRRVLEGDWTTGTEAIQAFVAGLSHDERRARAAAMRAAITQESYLAFLDAVAEQDASLHARAISVPTFVIGLENDLLYSTRLGKEVARAIAGAQYDVAADLPTAWSRAGELVASLSRKDPTGGARAGRLHAYRGSARADDELTRREEEVLRLLADGQSNPQIAEALAITSSTVARHVTHLFRKIGCENRVEATRWQATRLESERYRPTETPTVRYATGLDDVRLAYAAWGSGSAVTWVAGTQPESASLPEDLLDGHMPRIQVLRGVAVARRAVVYDSRGVGASGRDIRSATLDDHVGDLESVLEAAGVTSTVLVAFHWGATVAVAFARRFPSRVRGLILWGPSLTGQPAFLVSRALHTPQTFPTYEVFSEQVGRIRAPWWGVAPREAVRIFRENLNEADWRLMHSERVRTFDVTALSRSLDCPVLVLHDPDVGAVGFDEGTRLLAASVPHCQVHEISGLTPTQIVELASSFLDQMDRERPDRPDAVQEAGAGDTVSRTVALEALTPREREVLAEVARGQSNRQIGATLDIAPATVARHVSHLLRKTGCRNRIELTRYAVDRRLLS